MHPEESAWKMLVELEPQSVTERAICTFSESDASYLIKVFGMPVYVDVKRRAMSGTCDDSELVLGKLAYFSRLSILHYLIGARAVPLSGRLVSPLELKTGQIYFRGSHVLPLDLLAAGYAADIEGFHKQGARFGGRRREYGDSSVELFPLPRLPVTLILWRADEEFAARSGLLFDASCEEHVPSDILWSVAMLSTKVMLTARGG